MNQATPAPVREGDILAGKYRVDKVLGVGGMGVVVAARHLQLDQKVALKFLLPDAIRGVETVERFLREARAAVKIQSEHVARVLDVGTLESGLPYMVMEYLAGRDLAAVLEGGSLPVEEAVGYILQACEAVAEAHAAGIIHRDIKPANLFLANRATGSPTIKVLDFGISKLSSNANSTRQEAALTRTSTIMGSPLYMSPEQMTSTKNVDARADIWSLGVTLYELVGGQPPFGGDSMPQLIAAILQSAVVPLHELRPNVPPAFDVALARALERNRDARYANIAELAIALAPFGPRYASLSVERISQVLGVTPPLATPRQSTPQERVEIGLAGTVQDASLQSSTGNAWGRTGAGTRSSSSAKAAVLAGGVIVLTGLAATGVWLARRSQPSPSLSTGTALVSSATTNELPALTKTDEPSVLSRAGAVDSGALQASSAPSAVPSPKVRLHIESKPVAQITPPVTVTTPAVTPPTPPSVPVVAAAPAGAPEPAGTPPKMGVK